MIRAILRNGMIHSLDPLTTHWEDGRELQIVAIEPSDDPEAIERWCHELNMLEKAIHDPDEWKRFDEALTEADRLAKGQVRKEIGLD